MCEPLISESYERFEDNVVLSLVYLHAGIPQGSVLQSLLCFFLLYFLSYLFSVMLNAFEGIIS